jgi:hypothetical protein
VRRAGTRWLFAGSVASLVAAGMALVVHDSPASAASSAPGSFTSVTPARVLDTRDATGVPAAGAVAAHATVVVQVDGRAGVPASGVSAAVLHVTVTRPSSFGWVAVWGGGARPDTSSLNFDAGKTVANQVTTPVSSNGTVSLYNGSAGTVQLIADISGYYVDGTPQAAGMFASVTPDRLLDTRDGSGVPAAGAVAAHGAVVLQVDGRGGVPASGVSAVVLNVAATQPSSYGWVAVWGGGARPNVSNLNFDAHTTVANLVTVPVSSDGTVSLYNGSAGTVQLIADVFGYYLAGGPLLDGGLGPVPPDRVLDTRDGTGVPVAGTVAAGATVVLKVGGRGWVLPSAVSAVVLNVAVTQPSSYGWVAVWGAGTRPETSSVNFDAGKTVANLVVTPVASDGTVSFYNGSAGTVQLIADVFGYVLGADRGPAPAASTGRYVRNLSDGGAADVSTMHTEGCADAADDTGTGPYLHLLHVGAQSQHAPLSKQNPGVALTGFAESATPRLTYPELVTALEGYLDGYVGCRIGSASVTIAIGTNNDGDWQTYTAAEKGADWATQVIEKLRTYAAGQNGIDVVGANDIEAGFSSSEADAENWETAYLGKTSANLIYDGSLDACPTAFGATGSCGSVSDDNGILKTWTQAQYIRLTHGLNPTRIDALPQIYYLQQAWQWANLAFASGGQIGFSGSLTEYAAVGDGSQYASEQGWGALSDALAAGTQVTVAAPQSATDLRADWPATTSAARKANATLPNG